MAKEKRSFFERLTGAVQIEDDEESSGQPRGGRISLSSSKSAARSASIGGATGGAGSSDEWEEEPEGQLTVDVHQTPSDIIIQTMVAGVKPEDLDISITRDMVTIKGKREAVKEVSDDDFFFRELYWGTFSRTILLPQEIEVEESEATERYGLLTIRLPKIDKGRQTKLRVKSS